MGAPGLSSSILRSQLKPQSCWERDVEVTTMVFILIYPHSPPDFLE